MTDDNDNTTDASTDDRFGFDHSAVASLGGANRRTVLKSIGAGALLAGVSGTVAGDGDEDEDEDEDTDIDADCEPCSSPAFGYAATDSTAGVEELDPVHNIGLHVHGGDATHEGFPKSDGEDPNDQDDLPEFFFDPVGVHIKPDEVLHFQVDENHLHTVTAFDDKFGFLPERIPSDAPGFTSPFIVGGESWFYRFHVEGVYDLLCLPHGRYGMVIRVVVHEDGDIPDTDSHESLPKQAGKAADVLDDPALDPANIVNNGPIAWADLSL